MANRRHKVGSFRIDRAAVRAVISREGLKQLERVRAEHMPGRHQRELFWRAARKQMVQSAQRLPNPTARMLAAKIGAVGAMLGLSSPQVTRLLQKVNVPIFIAAATSNLSIQQFQKDPQFCELWNEQIIRSNPPLRVEFEHAIVFGSINEAGDIAKNKSWGLIIDVGALRPDDRLFPRNITYILKSTSKLRMRWEFRDTFKNILGSRRSLVADAIRSTKRRFLGDLSPEDAKVIKERLCLTGDEFWRIARQGEKFGPDGIASFVRTIEERTRGYVLPFPEGN